MHAFIESEPLLKGYMDTSHISLDATKVVSLENESEHWQRPPRFFASSVAARSKACELGHFCSAGLRRACGIFYAWFSGMCLALRIQVLLCLTTRANICDS